MALATTLAVALASARALALAALHILTRVLAVLAVLAGRAVLAVVVGHFVYSEMRFFIERPGRRVVGARHPEAPNLPRGVGERRYLPESVPLVGEAPGVWGALRP